MLASLPREVSVTHPVTGREERLTLTRDMLVSLVRLSLYVPAISSALPLAINDASAGLWTTVGNPGNAADQNYGPGQFGAVAEKYRIGKTEVTNVQYAAFLNAKAGTNGDSIPEDARRFRGNPVSGQNLWR